jgi:hypothetical protein
MKLLEMSTELVDHRFLVCITEAISRVFKLFSVYEFHDNPNVAGVFVLESIVVCSRTNFIVFVSLRRMLSLVLIMVSESTL